MSNVAILEYLPCTPGVHLAYMTGSSAESIDNLLVHELHTHLLILTSFLKRDMVILNMK